MSIFSSRQPYDRGRLLQAAARAHKKKRRRKAITLYRQVLAMEPDQPQLHAKLATLLAQKGERFDAWTSYKIASQQHLREGNVQDALTVLREAVRLLPGEFEVWQLLSRIERKEGQARHAKQTLVGAVKRFRRDRPRAIYLLRRLREIEPWDFEAVLPLARLLAQNRQKYEALLLLDQLSSRVTGVELRRVRGAQWRMLPSLAHTWLWFRAAMGDGSSRRRTVATSRR